MNWNKVSKYEGSQVIVTIGEYKDSFGNYYLPPEKFSILKQYVKDNFTKKSELRVKKYFLRQMELQIINDSKKEYFIKNGLYTEFSNHAVLEIVNIDSIEEDIFPALEKYHNETSEELEIYIGKEVNIVIVKEDGNNVIKISFHNSKKSRNECKEILEKLIKIK